MDRKSLLVGILIGGVLSAYVVPMIKARVSGGGTGA